MIVTPKNTRDILLQATGTRVASNFLSMEEKPSVISIYNNILSNLDTLSAEATKFGITTEKTNLTNKVNALTTYLGTLNTPVAWNVLTNITFITRTEFDQKFVDVSVAEKLLRDVLSSRGTIEAYLTVPSISVTADSTGNVSGGVLASSGGIFSVFAGISNITTGAGVVYSVVSQSGCTVSINSTSGVFYPTSLSSSSANATLRAQLPAAYGSISVDRVYSISKVNTGSPGPKGDNGPQGAQARIAYTLIDGGSMNSFPSSLTVAGDTLPSSGAWGATRAWQVSPYTSISAGQSLFQSNGLFDPVTGYTTWYVPYLSNLKVGTLSVLTTDTGTLTIGANGFLRGGQSAYNTGNGFWQGYDSGVYKMSIGTDGNRLTYDGSILKIDVYGGAVEFGKTSVSSSVLLATRDTNTTLPGVYLLDSSTSNSAMLYVANTSSFTGNQLVSFSATKGESLRATTNDSAQFCTVFQNLGGSTTAIALAGTTHSGYAGVGDGSMNIADGYLPFTGIHIGLLYKNESYELGDIVESIKPIIKKGISNTMLEVKPVTTYRAKAVFGVISGESLYENYLGLTMQEWYELDDKYIGLHINSVGEGCINVCGIGGNIESGDLITSSSIRGKGMKQKGSLVRNYTVAKATESVTFEHPEEIKQISCTYMCG